ncbi:transporter suffix domain-containing protein [Mariprofundus erugo]|uniref:Transporter suffix domain-containing protein n=1 Tax=Mariprofundus erugo TaxID=2528639 RepID=A0A5R9GR73_9PROT|nr:transporter suffix domain-containing protein [Mariprofundus erugo]TLS66512.1 transporter suffix domain-containing protein [Mariprofundus erugo]TLS77858.1 transporter suffix domain-containing protein [Mariprofundus erugo]
MQRFKRLAGLGLFCFSWMLWGVIPLLPFIADADGATIAAWTTAVLVVSELCFYVSLLLLGRPFYLAFKAGMKGLWYKLRGRAQLES